VSRYIIDTNIIIMHPGILSTKLKKIIPDVVLDELKIFASKNETYNKLLEIIQSNPNSIHIVRTNSIDIDFQTVSLAFPRISKEDLLIANLAKEYTISHAGEEIYLVTQDKDLQTYCKQINVRVLNLNEIKAKIEHEQKYLDIEKKVNKLNKDITKNVISSLLSGVISSLLVSLTITYAKNIYQTINIWGVVILIPFLGVFFYYIRSRFRLIYGITEFFVGVFTSLKIFIPSFDISNIHTDEYFQILGGLYIIVRGMDNIGKGLENTKFSFYWKIFFKG